MKTPVYRTFETGATRDLDDFKANPARSFSWLAIHRYLEYKVAKRAMPDGTTRADDNWKKGIPLDSFMESLTRHVFEALRQWEAAGRVDEATLCAIWFNTQGALHETIIARGCTLTRVADSKDDAVTYSTP